jgi:multicomponent Na+:H+ antiporter subunit B
MDFLTLTLLMGLSIAAVRVRDLLAATAMLGAYSLMMAVLWCQMNALDVAFTEAAVGAGISTVLMLAALLRVGSDESKAERGPILRSPLLTMQDRVSGATERQARWRSVGGVVVCLMVGAALFYGTADMPPVGDASSPANTHPQVAEHYLNKSKEEVGPPNVVTSVLGDYRGYDTMGETCVIFTAALCVLMLLRLAVPGRGRND